MNHDDGVMYKAKLLEAGSIHTTDQTLLSRAERSTAGVDAGLRSVFLRFDRYRVRVVLTPIVTETPFMLERMGDGYIIKKNGSLFMRNLMVEKPTIHAPQQVFLNLASPCIFDCKFCATPKLKVKFTLEPERVLALIRSAMKTTRSVEAIALTSSIFGSEAKTTTLMVDTVKRIRKEIDHQIPIGVEPYITKLRYVDELYSSGADEIKVNVESFNREIITNVCPDMEYDKILSVLAYSPRIFGKNRVCSNVIIGLGETDAEVLKGIEGMAKIGVVANLRPLYINPYRRRDIAVATQKKASRPSATRMVKLALNYKSILEAHDLKTSLFQTMCYKCTGCEIAPQQDI